MKNGSLSTRLGDDGCGMVTAHVIETPQNAVIAAHHDDGFAGNAGRDKLARLLHLLHPSHHLPGLAENSLGLKVGDSRVHIPGRGDGRRVRQGSLVVVARENFRYRHMPVVHAPIALFSTSRNWVMRASFFSCGSPWRRNRPGSNSSVSSAS